MKKQQRSQYLEDTPRVLKEEEYEDEMMELDHENTHRRMKRDKSNIYSSHDDEKGTFTARRQERQLKNSMYLEEGSVGSGSDTLNDRKLLNKISQGEQEMNKFRCETPPEFVDSGVGYTGFMNSVKL